MAEVIRGIFDSNRRELALDKPRKVTRIPPGMKINRSEDSTITELLHWQSMHESRFFNTQDRIITGVVSYLLSLTIDLIFKMSLTFRHSGF